MPVSPLLTMKKETKELAHVHYNQQIVDVVLASLLLTLNRSQTMLWISIVDFEQVNPHWVETMILWKFILIHFTPLVSFYTPENITTTLVFWSWQGSTQGSRVQNHWIAPTSTQPFILPRSIKWVSGISENLVVKSKLLPQSGSSLEAVELHP